MHGGSTRTRPRNRARCMSSPAPAPNGRRARSLKATTTTRATSSAAPSRSAATVTRSWPAPTRKTAPPAASTAIKLITPRLIPAQRTCSRISPRLMSAGKRERLFLRAGIATTIAVVSLVTYAVTAVKTGSALKTPWGEPDLQGIWSRDVDIPLERPAKYANQEFFSDAERAELDRQIADIIGRDSTESRRARGTERDVNTEFAQAPFTVHLPVGRRTSLIIDPPDGKIPPLTPEAQKARDGLRQFQVALLQPTAACKEKLPGCAGGKYGPVSPRRSETPPMYLSGVGGG